MPVTPPTDPDDAERPGEAADESVDAGERAALTLERRRALAAIAGAALSGFADVCLVYALDGEAWRRECVVAGGADEQAADCPARLPEGLPACVAEVVAARRPRLLADADEWQQAPDCLQSALGGGSLVLVPGEVGGQVIVVLALLRRETPFVPGELAAAGALAATAALTWQLALRCERERVGHGALAVSEARFRALVTASAMVVWTARADGSAPDGAPEHGWLDALHPDDRVRAAAAWQTALRERQPLELEARSRRPDGSYAWVVIRAAPVRDEQGRLREWVGKSMDISERKRFEAALQESEARLRLAVEAAEIGTWDYDPRSGGLVWSEREKALFGLSPDVIVDHEEFLRGVHVDDRERAVEEIERAQDPASGGHYRDEFRTVGLEDGIERWISARGRCFFDERGVPMRFIGVDVDVTEKRLSSQRVSLLAEASRALVPGSGRGSLHDALASVARRIAERLGDACWVTLLDEEAGDLQSVAIEARGTTLSAQLAPLRGLRVAVGDDWLGAAMRSRRSLLIPILNDVSRAELLRAGAIREVLTSAAPTSVMLAPMVSADRVLGLLVCLRTSGRAYGRADLLVLQDLADRCALAVAEARSFREAERTRQQIESIIDAAPFLISYVDASGRYAYVSRGYELWFGRPRSEFVGQLVRDTVGPAAFEIVRPMVEGALLGVPQKFEMTLPYERGGAREVDAVYLPQFDEAGRPAGFVAVILDVSEHKALVETLRRSLRFSEEFVGILGHDLRSPLTAIVMTCAALQKQVGDPRAVQSVLRIRNSAGRMARMIEQILDFTRARLGGGIPIRPAPVELATLARTIVAEVQSGTERSIELSIEGDTRGEWDPDRLEQVLSNLLANAVEYGGEGAPVRVRIRGTAADAVLLTVANAGVIPPAVLPVVFDRFKRGVDPERRSRGLGLGLYIVQQIVIAHGGAIEVQSSPGAGTRFSVRLPRTACAREADAA